MIEKGAVNQGTVKLYLDSIRFKIERWGLAWVNQIIWGWLLWLLHGTCYGTCFYLYYHGWRVNDHWTAPVVFMQNVIVFFFFLFLELCFISPLMQRKWNCTTHLSLDKCSQNVTMWVSNYSEWQIFFYCLASREWKSMEKVKFVKIRCTNLCIGWSEQEQSGTPCGEKETKGRKS